MCSVSVHIDVFCDFEPIPDQRPGTDHIPLPDCAAQVFQHDPPRNLYAVIDAARVPLLPERLAQSKLPHASLFTGAAEERLADVAPYLVALHDEDEGLSWDLFRHDPDAPNPRHILPRDGTLMIRSRHSMKTMLARLRQMTMLPDESGARLFLRMCEPGVLAAACLAASPKEVAWVFNKIDALFWTRKSLEAGEWQILRARPDDSLSGVRPKPLVLRKPIRDAMALAVIERRARTMARAHSDDLDERIDRALSYSRMMNVRYSDEGWLRTTHDLISDLPEDRQDDAWALIESGNHSLGQAHARIATQNGRDLILPHPIADQSVADLEMSA